MVRRRSKRHQAFPANLYERGGYYSWRDPRNGTEHGLGRDRDAAFEQAIEANHLVAGDTAKLRLADKLLGRDQTVDAWLDLFEKRLKRRALAPSTRANWRIRIKAAREQFGQCVISRVTTKQIAEFIDGLIDKGQARSAQHTRSALREIFTAAQAAGWVEANPVEVTEKVTVKVRRARLTLDNFQAIYEAAAKLDPWVQHSMMLALVTAQRREDIALAKFADIHDDAWWCEQEKTGTKVAIPLKLRLDALDVSVAEAVRKCRDNVVSRYLIHHTKRRTMSNPGDQVWKDTISKGFARARRLSMLTWPASATPPTFHEIRSLAERLYKKQGIDTQALLGHKDPRTTAGYDDSRGAEWVRVAI